MLTNKVFLRKNKRGNVLKIIREHYLRTDLWCGSRCCVICPHEKHDLILSENPTSRSALIKEPHYLLLDTNVILDQIDIFEEDVLSNVIVVQTVIDEVKHRSTGVYKRLRDILSNPARSFYTFVNEHHRDTYIEREPKESSNDRNDRAIRKAAIWYQNHLNKSLKETNKSKVKIILLTDDADNRRKANDEGIEAYTVENYVKSLTEFPHLQDKLCLKEYANDSGKLPVYPPHLTVVQMHDGIKSGKFYQGSFMASRENFLEGNVNVECFEKFVLIQGRESLNRAIDGDTVCVEVLPESDWSSPSDVVLEDNEADPVDENVEVNEDEKILKESASNKKEKQTTGRIIGIIKRKWRQYCGILKPNEVQGSARHIFIPADRKIPRVRIETRQAEKLYNQRIIVAIDQWPRHSRYPQGHFVRILGPLGDKETENEVLLIEHDVPHSKFSQEVLNCLPSLPWIISEQDYKERVDLRNITICSVDPPGCTDIDDALHSRLLPNGNIEVGVHIADVSHFIRPGTAMDKEAALRATTVYLVDKRIDMVPELLSSNLCSLRGNVERFAFSCVWEMDKDANIVKTKFHKSVIESKAALTYEEAQIIIDDKNKNDDIAKSLRQLNQLAKILKRRRIEKG
ncbi:hypothetical protein ACKWTF_003826 [Chironomus riparius]